MQRFIFIIPVLFLLISLSTFCFLNRLPRFVLWAWERPEDLSFLEDKSIGVAYYAGGIVYSNYGMELIPRLNTIIIKPETKKIAVIRIDNKGSGSSLKSDYLKMSANFITNLCKDSNLTACQIDFEVRSSEKDFYKKLISEVRNKLTYRVPLTITALASWCDKNSWLNSLAIMATPMFYRLGLEDHEIKTGLVGKTFMQARACQKSIGVSTDEKLPDSKYFKNKSIFIFNPNSWTSASLADIMSRIK